MKLIHLASITTGVVVVLGFAMLIPVFTQSRKVDDKMPLLLTISIIHNDNTTAAWCREVSAMITKQEVEAVVFVTGNIAQSNPDCVSSFSPSVDIGSQTYSYSNLTSVSDYGAALKEIQKGKQAVDTAGNLDSRLFKAPYGATDGNIYSLLSRSGIIADFSYPNQYNKYENNQFIKYSLRTLSSSTSDLSRIFDETIRTAPENRVPIAVNFDSSVPVGKIDKFVADVKSNYGDKTQFVNASDLTGMSLTIRSEGNIS
jgi:uncharacterized NAD(P)/FAD-binding protein YdhS